jgi:hypothetical protein
MHASQLTIYGTEWNMYENNFCVVLIEVSIIHEKLKKIYESSERLAYARGQT